MLGGGGGLSKGLSVWRDSFSISRWTRLTSWKDLSFPCSSWFKVSGVSGWVVGDG